MSEPRATVMWTNATTASVRSLPKRSAFARRDGFDVLLGEAPAGLDGIQVGRIRRQKFETRASRFDEVDDLGVLVRLRIVHDDDVAEMKLRREAFANPTHEARAVRGGKDRSHRDPTVATKRADHRHRCAPIHRTRIVEHLPATNPRVRTAHREIRRGFVDENEATRIDALHSSKVLRALQLDVGPILLRRTYAFFLNTKPARRSARWMLER